MQSESNKHPRSERKTQQRGVKGGEMVCFLEEEEGEEGRREGGEKGEEGRRGRKKDGVGEDVGGRRRGIGRRRRRKKGRKEEKEREGEEGGKGEEERYIVR